MTIVNYDTPSFLFFNKQPLQPVYDLVQLLTETDGVAL